MSTLFEVFTKEYTMFQFIVTAQNAGKNVAVVDLAHAFDIDVAKVAGVNVEQLIVSQPDTMPQAAEIGEVLALSGAINLLVIIGEMSTRQLVRVRECASRTGAEVATFAA